MENQRVYLSKKLLENALISLLKQKSLYKISIRELCEVASINRSTFYKYFSLNPLPFTSVTSFTDINDFLS